MKFPNRREDAIICRKRTGAGGETSETFACDGGVCDGGCALCARHIACEEPAKGIGSERLPRVNGIRHRGQKLVGCDFLEALHAIVKPNAQAHIRVLEGGCGNRRHVCQRGVAKLHRVKSFHHRQGDRCGGLGTRDASRIITPVCDRAI